MLDKHGKCLSDVDEVTEPYSIHVFCSPWRGHRYSQSFKSMSKFASHTHINIRFAAVPSYKCNIYVALLKVYYFPGFLIERSCNTGSSGCAGRLCKPGCPSLPIRAHPSLPHTTQHPFLANFQHAAHNGNDNNAGQDNGRGTRHTRAFNERDAA